MKNHHFYSSILEYMQLLMFCSDLISVYHVEICITMNYLGSVLDFMT